VKRSTEDELALKDKKGKGKNTESPDKKDKKS
jgi:hypothetical protein